MFWLSHVGAGHHREAWIRLAAQPASKEFSLLCIPSAVGREPCGMRCALLSAAMMACLWVWCGDGWVVTHPHIIQSIEPSQPPGGLLEGAAVKMRVATLGSGQRPVVSAPAPGGVDAMGPFLVTPTIANVHFCMDL